MPKKKEASLRVRKRCGARSTRICQSEGFTLYYGPRRRRGSSCQVEGYAAGTSSVHLHGHQLARRSGGPRRQALQGDGDVEEVTRQVQKGHGEVRAFRRSPKPKQAAKRRGLGKSPCCTPVLCQGHCLAEVAAHKHLSARRRRVSRTAMSSAQSFPPAKCGATSTSTSAANTRTSSVQCAVTSSANANAAARSARAASQPRLLLHILLHGHQRRRGLFHRGFGLMLLLRRSSSMVPFAPLNRLRQSGFSSEASFLLLGLGCLWSKDFASPSYSSPSRSSTPADGTGFRRSGLVLGVGARKARFSRRCCCGPPAARALASGWRARRRPPQPVARAAATLSSVLLPGMEKLCCGRAAGVGQPHTSGVLVGFQPPTAARAEPRPSLHGPPAGGPSARDCRCHGPESYWASA